MNSVNGVNNSITFPVEISQAIKAEQDKERLWQKVETTFQENSAVVKAYLVWSKSHPFVVEKSQELIKINELAGRVSVGPPEEAVVIVCQDYLKTVLAQLELLSIGLITMEECLQNQDIRSYFSANTSLFNGSRESKRHFANEVMPLLNKLTTQEVLALLTIRDELECAAGLIFHVFKEVLPFLNRVLLSSEERIQHEEALLDIFSTYDPDTNFLLLGDKSYFAAIEPTFERMCQDAAGLDVVKKFLSVQVGFSTGTIFFYDCHKPQYLFLEKLLLLEGGPRVVADIIGATNAENGNIFHIYEQPFHRKILDKLLLTTDGLSLVKEVLSQNYVSDYENSEINYKGTPLHNPIGYSRVEPLLHMMLCKAGGIAAVSDLLATKNEDGFTPLFTYEIFKGFIPLLLKIAQRANALQHIWNILSVQDRTGRTLLHSEVSLLGSAPLLEKISEEKAGLDLVIQLLCIKDAEGVAVVASFFTSQTDFTPFVNILNKLDGGQAEQLLLSSRVQGEILLHKALGSNFDPVCLQGLIKKMTKADFDPATIPGRGTPDAKVFDTVGQWLLSDGRLVGDTINRLLLPLYLGYTENVAAFLALAPVAQRTIFYEMVPALSFDLKLRVVFQENPKVRIRPQHMHEGVSIQAGPPAALDMSEMEFVDVAESQPVGTKRGRGGYAEFYSFLPDFLKAVETEGVVTPDISRDLRAIERKIRTNEHFHGLSEDERTRKQEYQVFCSYLTHVIRDYKLGLPGGNSEEKGNVLRSISEVNEKCFPRWMQEIKQIYFFRPRGTVEGDTNLPTFRDRLLARLRVERVHTLTVKLFPTLLANVHLPNYLLDLFREDLGTQLDPINDPENATIAQNVDKAHIRAAFDRMYHVMGLATMMLNHIREQQNRTTPSTDFLDLAPEEVQYALEELLKSTYHDSDIETFVNKVKGMEQEGKSPEEIEAYLSSYGIEWRLEEEVEDAESRLGMQIKGVDQRITRIPNLLDELNTIACMPTRERRADGLRNFIERCHGIPRLEHPTVNSVREAVLQWKNTLAAESVALKGILEEVKAATDSDKRAVLLKYNKLKLGQPLDEVLQLNVIKNFRAKSELELLAYDENRNFTPWAAVHLLWGMGVFELDL